MKLRPYLRNKPSDIDWLGDIPEHWSVRRGRFCMTINPRSDRIARLALGEEVSFLPMEAVGERGGLVLDQSRAIGDASTGYTEFQDGDVLVAKITPCFENGKGAIAEGLLNGAAFGTTELHVLRAGSHLESRFLFYLTMSDPFRALGEAEMYGAAGQKRVPSNFVSDFAVPLPPLHEQREIIAFLDATLVRLDLLICQKHQLIDTLREKRSALISLAVTRGLPSDAARPAGLNPHARLKPSGIDWIGNIPDHWKINKFYREVQIAEGQVDPEEEPYASMLLIGPNHVESETGRLLWQETAADQGAESGKYICKAGEVVYSKIRPNLAKVTIAPCQCLCSADMYPLSPGPNVASRYLCWLLLSRQFTA